MIVRVLWTMSNESDKAEQFEKPHLRWTYQQRELGVLKGGPRPALPPWWVALALHHMPSVCHLSTWQP